jgi:tetratricopeptide (TPR) repeat protein
VSKSFCSNRVGIVAGIGCLTLITVLALSWLDQRCKEVVRKETALYQEMVNGITLASDREYEAAIVILRPLVAGFQSRGFSTDNLTALIDAYLMSIVHADEPLEFSHDLNELLPVLEERMPRYGWRMHQVGWYFFRTGDLLSAVTYFKKAIADFEGFGDFRESADTYWAAALVNIAQGEKALAIANLDIAEERNYRVYNKDIFVADGLAYEHDPWFIRLGMQYKDFWPTIEAIMNDFKNDKKAASH